MLWQVVPSFPFFCPLIFYCLFRGQRTINFRCWPSQTMREEAPLKLNYFGTRAHSMLVFHFASLCLQFHIIRSGRKCLRMMDAFDMISAQLQRKDANVVESKGHSDFDLATDLSGSAVFYSTTLRLYISVAIYQSLMDSSDSLPFRANILLLDSYFC